MILTAMTIIEDPLLGKHGPSLSPGPKQKLRHSIMRFQAYLIHVIFMMNKKF